MDVVFRMHRNVIIEYRRQIIDVETAGGNVAGDKKVDFAVLEAFQGLISAALIHIAVQRRRV